MLYSLENTFNNYQSRLSDFYLFSAYPELASEIENYKILINNTPEGNWDLGRHNFELPINTGVQMDYYTLVWNIDKISDQNWDTKIQSIPTEANRIFSCPSRLNQDKLRYFLTLPKINKPIVLAFHLPNRQWLVIDGNHRYHTAKLRNEKTIEAILLAPHEHIQYMSGDLFRNLYRVHHNMQIFQDLCFFNLKKNYTVNKELGFYDFYPITNKDFVFSGNRRLKLKFRQLLNIRTVYSNLVKYRKSYTNNC